jgi:penicillin-binding protein 1A
MAGRRREPRFGGDREGEDLRVDREDRPAPVPGRGRQRSRGDDGPPRRMEERPRSRPLRNAMIVEEKSPRRSSGGGWGPTGGPPRRRSFLRRTFAWAAMLSVCGAIALGLVVAWYAANLPPIQDLAVPQRPPNIQILAADGTLLANRGDMGGAAVALKDLPPHVGAAFVAIEDRRFQSHFGIDPLGLVRAMIRNATSGHLEQGGSTLTQQLAKNLFLTQERSIERKAQEAILALWLERKYSKNQILEMYLNRVYFGAGAYGVEAAAQRYFAKPAKALTVAEAAMLAGLVKAPSRLAPTRNAELARARARLVVQAMLETGAVTEKTAKAALAKPASVARSEESSSNYAADWVTDLLDDFIGPFDADIVVETTIDPLLQQSAEQSLSRALDKSGTKLNVSQGALVAMEPSGAVRALVGGRSYAASQFNRVIAARRQPGSTFKPFVYLAALERGLTPDSVRNDAPVSIAGWRPEDFSKEYRGPVSLSTALALSLNTVAVRLCAEVGPKAVVAVAQRLGIASALQPNPSIALGTSEVTPLEITAAYAAFANGGRAIVPYVVNRVRTAKGKVLFRRNAPPAPPVVDQDKVGMMNAMMSRTLSIGTARKAALPGWEAAGKSGTSQNYRDAWFIGFTGHMVTGVWLGNDDGTSTRRITGGGLPAEIWNSFMRQAHAGIAPTPLPGPDWSPAGQDQDLVLASQPQVDGAPADQPVAMRPAGPEDEPDIGDWIRKVLGE